MVKTSVGHGDLRYGIVVVAVVVVMAAVDAVVVVEGIYMKKQQK